jgi:hypothetical protein
MGRESMNYGQACVRRSRVERHVSMSHAPQPARQNPHRIQPSYSVYQRVGAARRALASGRRARSSPIVFVITKGALVTRWCHYRYQTLAPTQKGEKPAPYENDREKGHKT